VFGSPELPQAVEASDPTMSPNAVSVAALRIRGVRKVPRIVSLPFFDMSES
jgi:hypothetical protein